MIFLNQEQLFILSSMSSMGKYKMEYARVTIFIEFEFIKICNL